MRKFISSIAVIISLCLAPLWLVPSPSIAQSLDPVETILPDRLLFSISGGFWSKEEVIDEQTVQSRGYYRLSAFRQKDNKSALILQEIELTPDGPKQILSIDIEEMAELSAYITDIRLEGTDGTYNGQGFAAYISLKTDPKVREAELWSFYVTDLGDIIFEAASN